MYFLQALISWTHIISATACILIGLLVLIKEKGSRQHLKLGIVYFYLMLINCATSLLLYNTTGKWFYAHTLAVVTIAVLLPGLLILKLRTFKYRLKVHITAFVLSYYLLIGGAINEAFLRIDAVKHSGTNSFAYAHFTAQIIFIGLLIFFLIKYHESKLER